MNVWMAEWICLQSKIAAAKAATANILIFAIILNIDSKAKKAYATTSTKYIKASLNISEKITANSYTTK